MNQEGISINKKVLLRALWGNYIALPIPPWWPFLGARASRASAAGMGPGAARARARGRAARAAASTTILSKTSH